MLGLSHVVARLHRAIGDAYPRLSCSLSDDVAECPGYMRLTFCRLSVPLLLFGAGLLFTTAQGQRAGLWKSRVDGAERTKVTAARSA